MVEPASVERMAFPLPDKPSIAVLPFDNLSGDAGQGHVADGLTEDIITALSKVSSLFVIARNSTFVYKGKPVKVQRVDDDKIGRTGFWTPPTDENRAFRMAEAENLSNDDAMWITSLWKPSYLGYIG